MTIPGGIRVKLSLALLVIVGGALLAAYAIIVPSLERRLVEAKLDQQEADAEILAIDFATRVGAEQPRRSATSSTAPVSSRTRGSSSSASVGHPERRTLLSLADSAAGRRLRDGVATRRRSRPPTSVGTVRARVRHDGREYAEVAVPLLTGGRRDAPVRARSPTSSRPSRSSSGGCSSPRSSALLIAVVARVRGREVHARRLSRLQRAADRIAEGAFDEPVIDNGLDEVGQLAASFDRMRVQLAQLDRARKEFVANASHELRTPLFSIGGFLELLDDEDLDESTRREFLATTREPGRPAHQPRHRPARSLADGRRPDPDRARGGRAGRDRARRWRRSFFALADASGHTLLLDVDEDAWAHADEERIQQIARALTGNALVHTPAGTTVAAAGRAARAAASPWRSRTTAPGSRAEHSSASSSGSTASRAAQASGSGLGLAIARELAGRMGGTVTVTSRPGATVFTLELPAEGARLRPPAPRRLRRPFPRENGRRAAFPRGNAAAPTSGLRTARLQ